TRWPESGEAFSFVKLERIGRDRWKGRGVAGCKMGGGVALQGARSHPILLSPSPERRLVDAQDLRRLLERGGVGEDAPDVLLLDRGDGDWIAEIELHPPVVGWRSPLDQQELGADLGTLGEHGGALEG